jgi:hypothetical protein
VGVIPEHPLEEAVWTAAEKVVVCDDVREDEVDEGAFELERDEELDDKVV